jgi:excisionase family DNA binding protein
MLYCDLRAPKLKNIDRNAKYAPPIGDHLLTLREAAAILRLSTRTVREYLQRGEIEGRIIGGRWRFRRADLDAFFANAPRNWDFS